MPLANRVCDAVCVGFAVWTIACHAIVALGGNLLQLIVVYGVALTATAVAFFLAKRRNEAAQLDPVSGSGAPSRDPGGRSRWLLQGSGLVLGGAVALYHPDAVALWWCALLLLGAAGFAFVLREPPNPTPPAEGRGLEWGLWLLGLACAGVALICHRFNSDDTFYVNAAIAAADFPGRALLSRDTMLGVEGLPLYLPAHRVHTYEVGIGALSYLTGIPAIYGFHWIGAAIAAFLGPLALARLFRLLTPRQWLWAVSAAVLVLLVTAEGSRSPGDRAFIAAWQGKSIYLGVFLPLIYAYAIEFGLRRSWRTWLLLCAAQIAAVGCSSSALWGAPAAALAAMACALPPARASARTFGLGALASLYVLAVGWGLKSEMTGLELLARDAKAPGVRLDEALTFFLGDGKMRTFGIASILVAWACCGRSLAQRFAIVVPLATTVVLLSPHADAWIRGNVTGPSYWRSLWALPLPILMALVLIGPTWRRGGASPGVAGLCAWLAMLAAFVWWVPEFGVFDERNGVRVGWPSLKVQSPEYEVARALNDSVRPGDSVIAPPGVSAWVPTFHHHAHPLFARESYLEAHTGRLSREEMSLRFVATRLFGRGAVDAFANALERFDVEAACVQLGTKKTAAVQDVLREQGFERSAVLSGYEIWVRGSSAIPPET